MTVMELLFQRNQRRPGELSPATFNKGDPE